MNSVIAFTTTRREGNARNPATLKRLLASRRLPLAIAIGNQIHGHKIQVVPPLKKTKQYYGVDGFLSAVPNQPLGIFTADCASIFLSAPSRGVVGLLHAGWRGVRGGILSKAVQQMRRRWRCAPQEIRMWLGPLIGRCCFEVQWDVARHFPAARQRIGEARLPQGGVAARRRKKDRWVVDLAGELQRQARRLGLTVRASHPECTRHPTRYHSFRRDQTEARQISVILRRPTAVIPRGSQRGIQKLTRQTSGG